MNNEELKLIMNQIKKYQLDKLYDSPKSIKEWISTLNKRQIKNFISINLDPNEIKFPIRYLMDKKLLDDEDFQNRLTAISKIKTSNGYDHLWDRLWSTNFTNSKNYYEDMEIMSKTPNVHCLLWIIDKEVFLNSPYHKEDLKLIAEAKDITKEDDKDANRRVAEALSSVAANIDSINSPYHREDMQLIANSSSKCLQDEGAYPKRSINSLATNKTSLKDKYHLDNMQILSRSTYSSKYLYYLMTDPEIIKGKYYREEIKALETADSELKALAIFNYIINPDKYSFITSDDYLRLLWNLDMDYLDTIELERKHSVRGSIDPNYIRNLELLNKIDDRYVLYVDSLLSNRRFQISPNYEQDLEALLNAEDKDQFIDLYKFMSNEEALKSPHHLKDLNLIKATDNKRKRKWLVGKATSIEGKDNNNHEFDMNYIASIDLDKLNKETLYTIMHYLFNEEGINHPKHKEILEKVLKLEEQDNEKEVLEYIESLDKKEEKPEKKKQKLITRFKNFIKKDI